MLSIRILAKAIVILYVCLGTNLVQGQERKWFESVTYFPKETYKKLDIIDSMGFIWRSKLLLNFGEQKLYNINNDSAIFRFTWLRSFDDPMIFVLVNANSKTTLYVKMGDRQGLKDIMLKSDYHYDKLKKKDEERFRKYLRGELDSISVADIFSIKGFYDADKAKFKYTTEVMDLPDSAFTRFTTILTESKFWTTTAPTSHAYHDGAGWMIEGYTKDNGYHVVNRHSPGRNGQAKGIREIGEYLIRLYGKIDEEKIY
jgi:hypothetical protein